MHRLPLSLLVAIALLCCPFAAEADMVDVLTVKMNDGCSLQKLQKLSDDFNAYYKETRGAQYEVLVPLHSAQQGVVFIVGRVASLEAFGKASDQYMADAMKDGSTANELRGRAMECASLVSRASAVTVK